MSWRRRHRCPKCRRMLGPDNERELIDGMKGVVYQVCPCCGWHNPVALVKETCNP